MSQNICRLSHHFSWKSTKRHNLVEIECNAAYLEPHLWPVCTISRKICGKVQNIIYARTTKWLCAKRRSLFLWIHLFIWFPCKLCAKVIHQCKRQKTHVHKPILVLNYLKTFSKIVHLIIYIFYNNSFFIIT